MSTTEEDLEPSVADEVVEELTAADDDTDGPNTAELDALDESLVESLEEYVSDDQADPGDPVDDSDQAVDGDASADDSRTAAPPERDADDATHMTDRDEAEVDAADTDDSGAMTWVFEDDEFGDDEFEDDDQTFDVPKIVMATESDEAEAEAADQDGTAVDGTAADDTAVDESATDVDVEQVEAKAGEVELPEVSDDILEELRRADIDGPIVEAAPQDDTTSAKRRPKKPVDYDPAPVPVPLKVPRILGRKARVRKVTRVVRHVDPWSVFKIAIIAHLVLYLILLTAGVLLWNVAYATGTIENVERFFESFGWQSFEFNGGEIYHAGWIAGLFGVLGLTGLAVLMATLFNLITDLVGGVRFTVLEEEVVESRSSPMRRFVVRRPEPEIPAVLDDGSGPIIREAVVDDTGDIER